MTRSLLFALLALALAAPVAASDIYRWRDDDGNVNYGANPPRGVDAERVDVRASRPASGGDREAESSDEEESSGEEASGDGQEPVEPEQDTAFQEEQCEAVRENLATLESGGTNRRFRNPDGEVVRYSEEELEQEVERLEALLEEQCED